MGRWADGQRATLLPIGLAAHPPIREQRPPSRALDPERNRAVPAQPAGRRLPLARRCDQRAEPGEAVRRHEPGAGELGQSRAPPASPRSPDAATSSWKNEAPRRSSTARTWRAYSDSSPSSTAGGRPASRPHARAGTGTSAWCESARRRAGPPARRQAVPRPPVRSGTARRAAPGHTRRTGPASTSVSHAAAGHLETIQLRDHARQPLEPSDPVVGIDVLPREQEPHEIAGAHRLDLGPEPVERVAVDPGEEPPIGPLELGRPVRVASG